MSASPSRPDAIELYLTHLNAALLRVPRVEREDFLKEIRVHIFEKLEQQGANIPEVLAGLGQPEELAQQFLSECSLSKSARSWSPWTLMKAATRWGLTGVQGFAMFFVGVIGYAFAFAFYACAVLKPFFPRNVGFYLSSQGLSLANFPYAHGHEVGAPWFIPTMVVLGFFSVAGTSVALRAMMRKFAAARQRLT